jgi:hypothetical protein
VNIQYTLLSDGSSDQALLPILSFVLRERGAETVEPQWADIGRLREPPQTLPDRIRAAIDLYPCDLLFVHRDAERVAHGFRRAEIIRALDEAGIGVSSVCVIPVRMTEAWLLFDEGAIREAAGRPRGRATLNLPQLRRLEEQANPKASLHQALRDASELRGRRLRDFPVTQRVRRVAELIGDYGALRGLSAFRALEQEVRVALDQFGGRIAPRD